VSERPFIEVSDLHFTYLRGTPLEVTALRGATMQVWKGQVVGIIGRAGSGKSTLVQHFNGLLRPERAGRVLIGGQDLSDPGTDVQRIRQQVGLVFQIPEQQLFERLVGDDIAFGPKKLGLQPPERRERVQWAMEMVGLNFESFKDRVTFSLSGGELRKVALAGVLALKPEVLIVDESTTGLDPRSRREMLDRLSAMHRDQGLTLVFVSPNMEEIAGLVDRVYVLDQGRVTLHGSTREVFSQVENLRACGLDVPQVSAIAQALRAQGFPVPRMPLTAAEGADSIWEAMEQPKGGAASGGL
jgi:energy-coupling factor transport system ATP-binding protein